MRPPRDPESYGRQQLGELPRGPIWPLDLVGVFGALLLASSDELARIDQSGAKLLDELDPTKTADMLDDWEQAYGLPDPCRAPPASQDERRRRLVQLVTMKGSTRPRFLTALAYDLGYDVLLEEFQPSTMGMSRCGDTLAGVDWRYAIFVHAPPVNVRRAYMGSAVCGDRISAFGNDSLECVIRRHAPFAAQPRLIFGYAPAHDTFDAAALWDQPGPASGVATVMPARAVGATYFLVGTFAAEEFGGSDAAYALIASATRISVGAATGGDSPRVTLPIAPGPDRCLISVVQTDAPGTRTVTVRINGAPAGKAVIAGNGAIAGDLIAFTTAGLDHLGLKQWPLKADEVDWLERVLARQFGIALADWPADLTTGDA